MALTIGSNLGQPNLRFSTPITGAGAGSFLRVVSGDARVGSEGLIIDRLTLGVMEITVREVTVNGVVTDTPFTIYSAEQVSGETVNTAIAGKGLTDAQGRSAVSAASTAYSGLAAIGIAR